MADSVVQLKGLRKDIKNKTIIHNLDLDLYEGEVFGFLGPNGAGKTTTIRMMVGLMKPTGGNVVIGGTSLLEDYEEAISQVGAIVENPELYNYMSGYKNLVHFSRMHKGVTKDRIQEVVDQVGLASRIHEKVKTYSLGMRQRLGLAQAILHKPKFLILDEPTNGLDPAGIREFRTYLRKIARDEGVSILVSSHLLSEIELMCDRVGIIQKGKLIDVRTVKEETDTSNWTFTVDQPLRAKEVLEEVFENVEGEVNERSLLLSIPESEVPQYNKALVEEGVLVYGIAKTKSTLEDEFLKVTGGEQVG
ncbi:MULTISPECIES: ABC transporter ATP-binding protein [Pontibacillus]|uniref:ABC transporter ATP-binding protein n=1 Tax=Pontibacillus chungwhensis TaxID=265426 RepID=A0ABY8UUZ2_9BACI|nr:MULTISPECIES: ABC transporter ATP-binding protein [Pontibacillus]MCD5325037.1 ABC transporter ATP-binding protein [Pontibacillus sp. HN14]WIF97294.1 ABC transporter ATP-binding protein [Pontibacillus chungwhensis]